ncbi:MAG TPA: beta-L-arabinofuranosidase domain-containing protein, partial [Verrucomicrobiae bacterium]|nr:beta-L-arabinofuranosidase domain-containing protein [Verrucomicrobiae bacterium]
MFLNQTPAPSGDLAHLYPENTGNRYPFNQDLIRRLSVDQLQSFHCVNLAQGIKQPIVYYQQDPDEKHVRAVQRALADIRRFHGQPQGMYGGDEPMHGPDPTQGIELCSVVEMMFSLETMVGITGDLGMADLLEWIAYNALPAQTTADYKHRQYLQCANQVLVTRARRNFYEEDWHGGTDLCFGLLTGYPCCTCNMHQGWPKFVQNLWRATADGGLAALAYGPSAVAWRVGDGDGDDDGVHVRIEEETRYPFEETIRFRVEPEKAVTFPLHLRVPGWARGVEVTINGAKAEAPTPTPTGTSNRLLVVKREWKPGDVVDVAFGAAVSTSRWHENSVAVERGPLVYALRIEEDWRWVKNGDKYGDYFEVHPKSPWNFGLVAEAVNRPEERIRMT